MQTKARQLDENRNLKLFGNKEGRNDKYDTTKLTAEQIREDQSKNKNAKFLREANKQQYMVAGLSLDERLNRNKHYRGKFRD